MEDPSKNILNVVDKQASEALVEQKYKLKVIIETILLCGREEISIRGSKDFGTFSVEAGNTNEGNLRALLRYRANGDDKLKQSLINTPKNATYISPQIQNEIIEVIGTYIQICIIKEVKQAVYFAILVDETTDICGKEQLSLTIRFYNKEAEMVKESFICYIELGDLKGSSISAIILNKIAELGLDAEFLRGQGYDGASNMSGSNNGVQSIIKAKYPAAIYIHCSSHVLNLSLNTTSKIPEIRNIFSIISEICSYFRRSPKRSAALCRIFEKRNKSSKRLPSYCETRWVERHDCVQIFRESVEEIVEALEEFGEDGKTKFY
ncbi:52 kDa repressor of the inhibitor of the protein kinase-like [Musca autumnalis]|uniref:52 kDa repressor of the inhibitor of the protein kinase-like n=1 Tax=Musca autumnalis TaxID=221902 RepID=UPI003CE7CD05